MDAQQHELHVGLLSGRRGVWWQSMQHEIAGLTGRKAQFHDAQNLTSDAKFCTGPTCKIMSSQDHVES